MLCNDPVNPAQLLAPWKMIRSKFLREMVRSEPCRCRRKRFSLGPTLVRMQFILMPYRQLLMMMSKPKEPWSTRHDWVMTDTYNDRCVFKEWISDEIIQEGPDHSGCDRKAQFVDNVDRVRFGAQSSWGGSENDNSGETTSLGVGWVSYSDANGAPTCSGRDYRCICSHNRFTVQATSCFP